MPTQSYPANPSWPPYLASLQAWGGMGGRDKGREELQGDRAPI